MASMMFPLALSLLGGLSTGLGSGCWNDAIPLFPRSYAQRHQCDRVHESQSFFGGVIVIALIVTLIPEPTLSSSEKASFNTMDDKAGDKPLLKRQRKQVWLSGIITAVGSQVSLAAVGAFLQQQF